VAYAEFSEGALRTLWRHPNSSSEPKDIIVDTIRWVVTDWANGDSLILMGIRPPYDYPDLAAIMPLGYPESMKIISTDAPSGFVVMPRGLSPDNRYLLYDALSPERFLGYIMDIVDGKRWQVHDGGMMSLWRADGKEVFYINHNNIHAVPVHINRDIKIGEPVRLFSVPNARFAVEKSLFPYAVSNDGGKFLFIMSGRSTHPDSTEIEIILNWHAEL
jgi:hypothetical protein